MTISLLSIWKARSVLLLLGFVSVTKGQQPHPRRLRFPNDQANGVTGKHAQLENGDSSLYPPNRKLQNDGIFSGLLQVEYQLTSAESSLLPGDIVLSEESFNNVQMMLQPVLDVLVAAYNNINIADPVTRRLDHVDIVAGVVEEADVGLGSLRLTLECVGSCNGCPSDAALTNHVTTGRRQLVKQTSAQRKKSHAGPRGAEDTNVQRLLPKSKRSSSSDRFGPSPTVVTPFPPPTPLPTPAPTPRPTQSPTPAPTTPSPTPQPSVPPTPPPTVDPDPFLPTEDQLLGEYSTLVMALNNGLVEDVVGLEEIDDVCPSSANANNGIPILSRSSLLHCPSLSPGFLVLDIDQTGFWCVAAMNDILGENLHLKPCDFNTDHIANDQGWVISSDHDGVFNMQSTRYPNVCVDVDGARLSVGTCTDGLYQEFEFDFVKNYLKLAGADMCVTNAGSTANNGDTVNARNCPTTADDDDYLWLFMFA